MPPAACDQAGHGGWCESLSILISNVHCVVAKQSRVPLQQQLGKWGGRDVDASSCLLPAAAHGQLSQPFFVVSHEPLAALRVLQLQRDNDCICGCDCIFVVLLRTGAAADTRPALPAADRRAADGPARAAAPAAQQRYS